MKIATIIPLEKGIFKDDLTYFTNQDISRGDIVEATIRTKKILGLVTSVEDVALAKSEIKNMDFNLKKILSVKGTSIFRKEFLDAVLETGTYFGSKSNIALYNLIPNIFKEEYDELAKIKHHTQIEEKNFLSNLRSEKLILQNNFEDRISIYKTLIRSSFAKKQSIFLVLPTEYDIKIFEEALGKGIDNFTYVLHGNIPKKKITDRLKKLLTESHPVLILGTAPYLCVPRSDIKTVILEHESSTAYKMIARPFIDLRTFSEIFAYRINAQYIMADTLLRFETIARKESENISSPAPISFRINFDGKIEIESRKKLIEINKYNINEKKEKVIEKFRIFNDANIEEIRNTLAKKKRIFIFALRKGLATYTVCRDCGEAVSCDLCNSPLVLYLSKNGENRMFACNRCHTEKDSNIKCDNCRSWNLIPIGIGTDTICKELKDVFSDETVKIFKLDKESAKNKKGAEKIIKDFEESKYGILVGTEMALFYLKEKVSLSYIASFDAFWSIPNYKISERMLHLVLHIISNTNDKLIIQTKNEQDGAIEAIKNMNLSPFVREELNARKELNYPPYARFIKISHLGDKAHTIEAKRTLESVFEEYSPEIFSGFVAKQKGQYATNALIKISPQAWSTSSVSLEGKIDQKLLSLLLSLTPNFTISVDPEDLL